MDKHSRVWVAGHRGLVGSAITRALTCQGYTNLLLRTRSELNLLDASAVQSFVEQQQPEHVFLAAARVGGILANSLYPADFIRENLSVQLNVIDAAYRGGVTKLVFLGSSCIYPRLAPQPIPEDALLTGPLESSNEAYAIAKIAGIKMVEAYRKQYGFQGISLMPTNLYGPGDNFDLETSHVIPALIRKFHEAVTQGSPEVVIWGSGAPRREFLHHDDLAAASIFLMRNYDGPEIVNVGTGTDITVRELAELLREISGFQGRLVFDPSRPDGTPRKLLDVSRLTSLGWTAKIPLREGLEQTYRWFAQHSP